MLDEEQAGGPIIPRHEADYVFGKLGAIVDLHERLAPQLNRLESDWSLEESRLCDVLQPGLLEEMDKVRALSVHFDLVVAGGGGSGDEELCST